MNRIRELREAAGMYQDELGELLNVGKGAISRYEREERQLDPTLICRLCDIFGCTADYLLGRSETQLPVITPEQAAILRAYEQLPPPIRRAVDDLIAPYKDSGVKKETA